jgi:hypothetical protein
MRLLRTIPVASLLVVAACTRPSDPVGDMPLHATTRPGVVVLTNPALGVKFYFLYEREGAALINWAPCVDPVRCPSLGSGEQVVIPNTAIGGYAPGKTEAIVYWWYGPTPPGPDDIHAIVVVLQAAE